MKKAKKQLKKPSQLKKTRTKQNYKHFIIVAIIVIISAIVFYPSLKNGFTNWDDPRYVTEGEIIQDLSFENIIKIFSEPYFMNYHPLTILSYALEYNYDKINPKVYHTTNYIFHLLNIVLVFILFYFISKRNLIIPSTVAFLFALHPMHVESVAWVAERKDVLYALFFLGSLITYVKFIENKNTKWYIFTIVLFILSLLSKPMAVTLPVVLVLLDYFYKRKFNTKLVLESLYNSKKSDNTGKYVWTSLIFNSLLNCIFSLSNVSLLIFIHLVFIIFIKILKRKSLNLFAYSYI